MVSREFPDWHAEDQVIANSFLDNSFIANLFYRQFISVFTWNW